MPRRPYRSRLEARGSNTCLGKLAIRWCKKTTMNVERFALRYPFRLLGASRVTRDRANTAINSLQFTLEADADRCVITVEPFDDRDAAAGFAACLWGALAHLLLDRSTPFNAPLSVGKVKYLPEGNFYALAFKEPVHGAADAYDAYVYRLGERIINESAGAVLPIQTRPAQELLDQLAGRAVAPPALQLASDDRLQTAVELYSASFVESSKRARLLTLVMAMEVLAPNSRKHPSALQLLVTWERELDQLMRSADPQSPEWIAFEALKGELVFRRDLSVRGRIRSMVRSLLPGDVEAEAQAIEANDARGKLVHEGAIDEPTLNRAISQAVAIVPRLITAALT